MLTHPCKTAGSGIKFESISLEALPPIATPPQVSAVTQIPVDSLRMDRYRGVGLPWVKIGKGRVRYLREDVLAYLAAQRTAV